MSSVLTRSYLTNLYTRTFYLFICSGHLNIGVYVFISAQRILFRFMFLFLCNHLRFLWGFCLIHVLIKWKKILLFFFSMNTDLKKKNKIINELFGGKSTKGQGFYNKKCKDLRRKIDGRNGRKYIVGYLNRMNHKKNIWNKWWMKERTKKKNNKKKP